MMKLSLSWLINDVGLICCNVLKQGSLCIADSDCYRNLFYYGQIVALSMQWL